MRPCRGLNICSAPGRLHDVAATLLPGMCAACVGVIQGVNSQRRVRLRVALRMLYTEAGSGFSRSVANVVKPLFTNLGV
jgi:hypothetical protein